MYQILHVSAEVSPFVKIGGLADVVGSLPGEIKRLRGSEVRVILPLYKSIPSHFKKAMEDEVKFTIQLGNEEDVYVGIKSLKKGNILYYFVDNEFFFGSRDNIYNYGDESKRFAYFQLAVLESLKHLNFIPDIVHVHDWHTAMIPLLLKRRYPEYHAKSVLSIHNLAYQGIFPLQDFQLFSINYTPEFEFEGFLNFLKTGIVTADILTTVSQTYANEIKTDYFGYGMQNLLKMRSHDLHGIVNGIDYTEFNPQNDKLIEANFDFSNYRQGKINNKKALYQKLGVNFDPKKPLVSIVSRLVSQKGIDLIQRVFSEMLSMDDFKFVVLGSGESLYEEYFQELEKDFPNKVKVYIGYSNELAHQIYASSDIFLMPSKYEPCGLGQIIALKYGSIPLVRETGGLVDTITPYNEFNSSGNGFSFTNFNAHDMMHVLRYAIHIYQHNKEAWDHIVKEAMISDFSWKTSAKEYRKLYKKIL
ncbi:glycogen synthase [Hujiaoplasma nucleasis]|uniref:Glycogen synthase n=1 Tax=Hujiaoplasma nucleasis TaxID=2725268 RepID=A0A7L6N382_9MOLU|nr:glycogen synthase [Hujiaoplasma nucleasis]QLY39697.1 glycogen synthase [Hujiaoplasma nucleasis]